MKAWFQYSSKESQNQKRGKNSEMIEEIGYSPKNLIKICDIHMAPGSVKEYLSIFFEDSNDLFDN